MLIPPRLCKTSATLVGDGGRVIRSSTRRLLCASSSRDDTYHGVRPDVHGDVGRRTARRLVAIMGLLARAAIGVVVGGSSGRCDGGVEDS